MLAGLRILEVGHFVAAPFATRLLGDLGADIIKIEALGGDPAREWGEKVEGRSLWWSMHGRNKRSLTLNLKHPAARPILLGLAAKSDALIENFRPGQLGRMGFSADVLRQVQPNLVVAHISGFGQTGPYRDRAAFGVIGEAIGGLRHLTDNPPGASDHPPVRVGVSIGDSVAGLYAALGVMAALWQRDRKGGDGRGRTLDVALTESILSLMEGMLPEYGELDIIKQPTGGGIATAAPTNAYPTADGKWILIAANSEPLFARLMNLLGRPDLVGATGFRGNQERVANVGQLDAIISEWSRRHPIVHLEALLAEADIPGTKVFTAADIAADPQYRHRHMVREVPDRHLGRSVLQAGVVPKVEDTTDEVRWAGPAVGEHTDAVLAELLGLGSEQIAALRDQGVI